MLDTAIARFDIHWDLSWRSFKYWQYRFTNSKNRPFITDYWQNLIPTWIQILGDYYL